MIAALSFPLLDAFLTILWIFLFVLWIWVLVAVVLDIFRSHDLGGAAKALWFLFILFLPLLGVVVYLVVRGGEMAHRASHRVTAAQQAYQDWFHTTDTSNGRLVADELEKLAGLRDRGVITDEELRRQKERLLG
jgi:hypothetical protein